MSAPVVVFNPVAEVLDELATCLCAQIEVDGLPPTCFCGVLPGAEVALEYMGDCSGACGQAWVRLATSYPSVSIGVPLDRANNCAAGIGLEIELGVMRCLDVGDGPEPPPPALMADAALLQSSDMMAMYRAVACCRRSKDYIIGQYTPLGPEGGVVGGTLAIGILVL